MGTYNLPRNVKGEGRILFVFSTKALIYTAIGAVVGLIFYFIFSLFNFTIGGLIAIGVFGLIGFIIGTFKMPDSTAFEITKKTGGENIDDVIKRAIKFKMQKNRIYVYEEDKVNKTKEKESEEGKNE
ncbi:MAG: PrgI family protein [Clostridia bacterium]